MTTNHFQKIKLAPTAMKFVNGEVDRSGAGSFALRIKKIQHKLEKKEEVCVDIISRQLIFHSVQTFEVLEHHERASDHRNWKEKKITTSQIVIS